MRYLIIMAIFVMPFNAYAGANKGKVATLMEALGLVETWSTQIEMGKAQNQQLGQQAFDQIMAQLNPSDEFKARFSKAFKTYIEKLEAKWSAEEIVDVWAGYYGPNFTDNELDQLIAFYTSELGKKDVAVTKQTTIRFSEHFQKVGQPIFEKATNEYIEELQIVASECNCRKKSP